MCPATICRSTSSIEALEAYRNGNNECDCIDPDMCGNLCEHHIYLSADNNVYGPGRLGSRFLTGPIKSKVDKR